MVDVLIGTFEFSDLGRDKVNATVTLKGEKDLWKFLKKYLMSKDIDWTYDIEENKGEIWVGGMRVVGQFRALR